MHAEDGGRIRYARTCEVCGQTVAYADIDRAYVEDGQTIVLTKDDIAALPAEKSREIDVVEFVPSDQVDLLTLDRPYYLEPDSKSPKAYVLLRKTPRAPTAPRSCGSRRARRHARAALRVRGDVLVLQTLLWADEVREANFPSLQEDVTISDKELGAVGVARGELFQRLRPGLVRRRVPEGTAHPHRREDRGRRGLRRLGDVRRGGRECDRRRSDRPDGGPAGECRTLEGRQGAKDAG